MTDMAGGKRERPMWNAVSKGVMNHNMVRPFFRQCEMCGGIGAREGETHVCRHCGGSGFVGPKGRFLPRDPHEPGAEFIWVSAEAPAGSLALKLFTGEVELHGLRIAHERVRELAEAARALLEEDLEGDFGEIRSQTRTRLKRTIDEAGK